MFENIPQWIINLGTWSIDTAEWWTTGIFGMVVYWLPMIILFVHYTMKSWSEIQEDRGYVAKYNAEVDSWTEAQQTRAQNPSYTGKEKYGQVKPRYSRTHTTIGRMLGRYFVACVPVVNLVLALFDALGEMMTSIVDRIKKIFDIAIISKPPK